MQKIMLGYKVHKSVLFRWGIPKFIKNESLQGTRYYSEKLKKPLFK